MARLTVFENISLDGYFRDSQGKMDFANKDTQDKEWNEYVSANASGGEIRKLKEGDEDIVIIGSGSIVAQIASHELVDEYQFVVAPVVLGKGRTLFDAMDHPVPLEFVKSQNFKNGNTVLSYRSAKIA